MSVIDADAHVVESERTWDFVDPDLETHRPILAQAKGNGQGKDFWIIGGRARPANSAPPSAAGGTPRPRDVADGARDMTDINARLAHMDRLAVDIQVLYPTRLLNYQTSDPETELALCRSYNRWLSHIFEEGKGRLRWVAVLPLMSMQETMKELSWAREHGACGALMHGIEGSRLPWNPYFFPLYSEASKLDLPICIHLGSNSFELSELVEDAISPASLPVIWAFHGLVFHRIPEKFPDLRWGFVEAASQWVPFIVNDLRLKTEKFGHRDFPVDLFKEYRLYVTCLVSDDIPYVLKYVGEDNLIVGSDYGHNDTSSQLEFVRTLTDHKELPAHVASKILRDNSERLYGL